MSTMTVSPRPAPAPARAVPARIPFGRILWVELTKMFNTRSGFWLTASIGITAVLATAAVIAFAPDSAMTYDSFGAAIGAPMAIILPVIAILSVTSEWSQRSGLTTFTLVPKRGAVIWAKLLISVALGALSMVVALGIGAVGNLVGAAIVGIEPVWEFSLNQATSLVAANVLGLLIGFMLGVLIRNSAAAIVGYFIYGFVLGGLAAVLAASQEWFRDLQPWIDFNYTQGMLFEGWPVGGEAWAQLGVTAVGWLVVPLAVGLLLIRRSEVK
ncbi:MAG TPA: ABC transporter permease [Nocardioides sp.]|nr:ABC transporter permease [Nocardioides sp.]